MNYKKIIATGGIISSLVLTGSTAFAETPAGTDTPFQRPSHMRWHNWSDLVTKLGLNVDDVKKEIESGKTLKDIFEANNITPEQIKSIVGERAPGMRMGHGMKKNNMHRPMPDEVLQAQASVLGITVDELKAEFQDHKSPRDLIEKLGLTQEQFHQKVTEKIQEMIDNGTITGDKAEFMKKMMERKAAKSQTTNK